MRFIFALLALVALVAPTAFAACETAPSTPGTQPDADSNADASDDDAADGSQDAAEDAPDVPSGDALDASDAEVAAECGPHPYTEQCCVQFCEPHFECELWSDGDGSCQPVRGTFGAVCPTGWCNHDLVCAAVNPRMQYPDRYDYWSGGPDGGNGTFCNEPASVPEGGACAGVDALCEAGFVCTDDVCTLAD